LGNTSAAACQRSGVDDFSGRPRHSAIAAARREEFMDRFYLTKRKKGLKDTFLKKTQNAQRSTSNVKCRSHAVTMLVERRA
jgi:hypothetical protein